MMSSYRGLSCLLGVAFCLSLIATISYSQVDSDRDDGDVARAIISPSSSADDDSALPLPETFRAAIESIESASGPFSTELLEPLQGLGDILLEQGMDSEAVQIYGRLLHINRINQGLFHSSQFAIVDKIIAGNLALGDWKALNDSEQYRFFLSQRLHSENITEQINSMERLMGWNMAYIGLDSNRDKTNLMLELDDMSESVGELSQNEPTYAPTELANFKYRRALIHYYLAVPEDLTNTTGRNLIAADPLSSGSAHLHSDIRTQRYFDELQRDNVFKSPVIEQSVKARLTKGKRTLEEMVALFKQEENAEAEAMSRLYLADWQLLAGRRNLAVKEYELALEGLLAMGIEGDRLNRVFYRPIPLPAHQPFFSFTELEQQILSTAAVDIIEADTPSQEQGGLQVDTYYAWTDTIPGVSFPNGVIGVNHQVNDELFLQVQFDVRVRAKRWVMENFGFNKGGGSLARGNVSNLTVLHAQTSSDKTRKEGLDDIRSLVFRPRLADGEALDVEKLQMKYVFALDQ